MGVTKKGAFKKQLGMFEEGAYMPALMLQAKTLSENRQVCHFAFPIEKLNVTEISQGITLNYVFCNVEGNNVNNKVPESANVYKKKTGLGCSFGPKHMPTACALYPLGELWKNKEKSFFSLDNKNCEGICMFNAELRVIRSGNTFQSWRSCNKDC
jgi:hypothetical protein